MEQHKTQYALEIEENRERRIKAERKGLMFYRSCTPCQHGKYGHYTISNRFYCSDCRPKVRPIPDEPNYDIPLSPQVRTETQRYSLIDTEKRVVKFYDALCKRSASIQPHYSSSGACACTACLEMARLRAKRNRERRRGEKEAREYKKKGEASRQNASQIASKNKLINSVWC